MKYEIPVMDTKLVKGAPVGWYNTRTKEMRWNDDKHEIIWMKESDKQAYHEAIKKEFEDFIE